MKGHNRDRHRLVALLFKTLCEFSVLNKHQISIQLLLKDIDVFVFPIPLQMIRYSEHDIPALIYTNKIYDINVVYCH